MRRFMRLLGDGKHGQAEQIQTFRCQACRTTFSARIHTPLYRLKTPSHHVALVLSALAEGLDPSAAERVFGYRQATITAWLVRAGTHAQCLHQRSFRQLVVAHIQLDELRTRLRRATQVLWLWVAIDPLSKCIPALVQAYDFSGIQTLMDVGGGQGTFLLANLQAHPALQGVLFDQAQAVEEARELIAQAGLEKRCRVMAGDFFAPLPSVGVDACILKQVLHDWDDQRCLTILRNCRRVLEPGKKLLIAELVLSESHASAFGSFLDLELLLNMYGRVRTEQQYRTLLEQSGFTLRHIVPTASSHSIIEGVAVSSGISFTRVL